MALSLKVLNPPRVWTVPEAFKTIYSHAVQVSDASMTLYISGQFGIGPDGSLPAEFAEQANLAMDNVEALLAASGTTTGNVVKLTYFLTRPSDAPDLGSIRRERWSSNEPPAVTAIVVSALARPEYLIDIVPVPRRQQPIDKRFVIARHLDSP
jgi:enamine deaminase RidA (YjgF/YER057c/UK114 family)